VDHGRAAIVQGDRSVLVEVGHPDHDRARAALLRFAEIEKSPEHVHTYRITDLSLWNAASAGLDAQRVLDDLQSISRFEVPSHILREVVDVMGRHGVCSLHDVSGDPSRLRLSVRNRHVRERIAADRKASEILSPCPDGFLLPPVHRGTVKQRLLHIGYPVDDRAGVVPGAPLPIDLRADVFEPYAFQQQAASAFLGAGSHGVVALPCGAGKTIVAILVMARLGVRTLVISASREACTQWQRELVHKTTLSSEQVALYDAKREVPPLALTTYSMLGRRGGTGPTGHLHFDRLAREPWGLIVYDEVHLLPAPVFRLTAELQTRRRLGLTATLVREDGRAPDVFALIGPKRHDVPWRELEASGHIAAALCREVRVPLDPSLDAAYAAAPRREQPRIAADNPRKLDALEAVLRRHPHGRLLVLGTYVNSLQAAARRIGAPVVTGETPHHLREELYEAFRRGEVRRLALSRVGNFALDLPEADVLIQLSGTMGSRQEEAQRLGRILRPKAGGATFYTLVTRDTVEQELALHRQLFLTEQGYRYEIEDHPDGQEATPTPQATRP
jgi:DNA excision repair protein ERCC-3